jgi:hypothetical protein
MRNMTGVVLPQVHPGDRIVVQSITGPLQRVATSEVVAGVRFVVVWACLVEEWEASRREERSPDAVPWPAEDVAVTAPN